MKFLFYTALILSLFAGGCQKAPDVAVPPAASGPDRAGGTPPTAGRNLTIPSDSRIPEAVRSNARLQTQGGAR